MTACLQHLGWYPSWPSAAYRELKWCGIALYDFCRQRKGIPSGPGAFRGADVLIALWISVGVNVVHWRGCFGDGGVGVLSVGGGGNIALRSSCAFVSKVVAVMSKAVILGVLCVFLGLVYFMA